MTRFWPLVMAVFLAAGCAQVPRESVELSATVGRDLAEMHRAHRELAVRYFGRMKSDVNQFVDEKYRPFIIRDTLEKLGLVNELKQENDPVKILEKMESYVVLTTKRIEDTRSTWIKPIADQEHSVLKAIDNSYLLIQNANSIVTGHLASVVRVHDAQADLLQRAGLGNFQTETSEKLAKLSDKISEIVDKARTGEIKIDNAKKELDTLLQQLKK